MQLGLKVFSFSCYHHVWDLLHDELVLHVRFCLETEGRSGAIVGEVYEVLKYLDLTLRQGTILHEVYNVFPAGYVDLHAVFHSEQLWIRAERDRSVGFREEVAIIRLKRIQPPPIQGRRGHDEDIYCALESPQHASHFVDRIDLQLHPSDDHHSRNRTDFFTVRLRQQLSQRETLLRGGLRHYQHFLVPQRHSFSIHKIPDELALSRQLWQKDMPGRKFIGMLLELPLKNHLNSKGQIRSNYLPIPHRAVHQTNLQLSTMILNLQFVHLIINGLSLVVLLLEVLLKGSDPLQLQSLDGPTDGVLLVVLADISNRNHIGYAEPAPQFLYPRQIDALILETQPAFVAVPGHLGHLHESGLSGRSWGKRQPLEVVEEVERIFFQHLAVLLFYKLGGVRGIQCRLAKNQE